MSEQKVTLVPIAMVKPTKEFIYAPSKIRPIVEVDHDTFISECADNGKSILVSFEKDGKSNPILTTTYTATVYTNKKPMHGRFIKK